MADYDQKVLSRSESPVPHGTEIESIIEVSVPGREKLLTRQYCRKVDMGDSCFIITHTSGRDGGSHTIINAALKARFRETGEWTKSRYGRRY